MLLRRGLWRLLRFAFHLFYNPFAFTYDSVSALVSRGHWRAWTRAAIPRIQGRRVLELPCGTGNLLMDMQSAGFAPIGADLSASMLDITRGKLQRNGAPRLLVRARAQALPFPTGAFDSVVMTFPPGFISDPKALTEVRRVLDDRGRLIWVDGARFLKPGLWSRLVNRWIGFVGGETEYAQLMRQVLAHAGFRAQVEWVGDGESAVAVATASKEIPA
jgi:ubiquinone/menaquinone biosynthesis C-methylase UbiE